MVKLYLTGVLGRLITVLPKVEIGLVRIVRWGLVAGGVLERGGKKRSPADPKRGDLSVNCVGSWVPNSAGTQRGDPGGPRIRENVERVLVLADIATAWKGSASAPWGN